MLGAIFEADLTEEQYACRPKRSAHDAVRAVHGLLNRGYTEVADADLSGYFDAIPHHELMRCVARRVSDGAMLALVKAWLEWAGEETDRKGHKRRTTGPKEGGSGTPQGAPRSPLLANLYRRRFLLGGKHQGGDRKRQAPVVHYADAFVILGRGSAALARARRERLREQLGLTVQAQKDTDRQGARGSR